jgi:hypothetical protein
MVSRICREKKCNIKTYLQFCNFVFAEPELLQIDQTIQVLDYLFRKNNKERSKCLNDEHATL